MKRLILSVGLLAAFVVVGHSLEYKYNMGPTGATGSTGATGATGDTAWSVTGVDIRPTTATSVTVSTTTISGNAFSVGTSTFVITAGNVGIGNLAPTSRLHISSGNMMLDGNLQTTLTIKSNLVDSYPKLSLVNDAQTWNIYNDGGMSNSLAFFDGANRMVINPTNGNVGIGNTAPDNQLSVGANMSGLSGGMLGVNQVTASGRAIIAAGGINSYTGTVVSLGSLNATGSAWNYIVGYQGNGTSDTFATMKFRVKGSGDIYSAGNVGIGTISPTTKLWVSSGIFTNDGTLSGIVTNSSMTAVNIIASGYTQLASKTQAELNALTPTVVGQTYYCSNCTNAVHVVVSTGVAIGQFDSLTGGVQW